MHIMRRAAIGPQCLRVFRQKRALRKNSPDAIGIPDRLTSSPTRQEARHG